MKLNVKGFGLTLGICWGLTAFLLTLLSLLHGTGEHLKLLGLIFFGYQVSYLGSIIGLVYGFIEGFASGALFAWLYNRLTA